MSTLLASIFLVGSFWHPQCRPSPVQGDGGSQVEGSSSARSHVQQYVCVGRTCSEVTSSVPNSQVSAEAVCSVRDIWTASLRARASRSACTRSGC